MRCVESVLCKNCLVGLLLAAFSLAALVCSPVAQAQASDAAPSLRERIQEKLKARRAERQDKKADSSGALTEPGTHSLTLIEREYIEI